MCKELSKEEDLEYLERVRDLNPSYYNNDEFAELLKRIEDLRKDIKQ